MTHLNAQEPSWLGRLPPECIGNVFEWLEWRQHLQLRLICRKWQSAMTFRMEMWVSHHGDPTLRGVWRPHRNFKALNRLAIRCLPFMSNTLLDGIHTINLTDWDTDVEESLRIASIRGLETLILKDCGNHTPVTMSVFLSAPKLRTVDLSRCKFLTDDLMSPFRTVPGLSLQTLDLSHCGRLTDDSMKTISNLSTLRFLDVSYCILTDIGVSELCKLRSLQVLKLNGCWKLSASAMLSVAELKCLESLELSGCSLLTDDAVRLLTEGLRYLDHLDLSGCQLLTDAALVALGTAKHLRSLHLTDCPRLTDAGVIPLATNLVELELLSLANCRRLTTKSFLALATNLLQLQQLTINGCFVTDTDLTELSKLPSLQLLEARDCIKITSAVSAVISRLSPTVQFLR